MVATTICNSGSRTSDSLFWPPEAPDTQVTHIHACRQNSHAHKVNRNEKENLKKKNFDGRQSWQWVWATPVFPLQIITNQLSSSDAIGHFWSCADCLGSASNFCNCELRAAHNWNLLKQAGLWHHGQGSLVILIFWIFQKASEGGIYSLALGMEKLRRNSLPKSALGRDA